MSGSERIHFPAPWQAPTSPVTGARNEHGRYRLGTEEQADVPSITFRETFLKSKAFEYLIAGEIPPLNRSCSDILGTFS